MNRLSTILLIITVVASTVVLAKDPINYRVTVKERKADQLFQLQSYQSCIELYRKVLNKQENNVRVTAKLAETYYALNQYSAAKPHYEFVIKDSSATEPKHLWHYAQVLASLKYTDEAVHWLTEFLRLRPNHRAARQQLYGLENREKFFADSSLLSVEPATFNSPASDFSPMFMGDNLVFTSARQESRLEKKYHRDGSSFLRLYTYDSTRQHESVRPFFNHDLPMHEGSGAFFANNAKFIFTANREAAEQVSDMQRINRLQLFRTELNSAGEWTKPQSILLNSKDYSIGHPAISEGGDTLYFTSNIPGGFGGTDIYVSYFIDESWTTPANLGANVNTEADEMFPTLFKDYLYFSSKGHAGLGGLDIYQISVSGLHKDEVRNVGFPINSSSDDFGLITKDGLSGYFSSNRSGNDDIFSFSPKYSEDAITLTVRVVDWNTNEPIPNVEVFLDHLETSERQSLITDEEGNTKIITDDHSVWNVSGNIDNKPWEFLPIHTDQLLVDKDNIVEIFLSQDDEIVEVKDFVISPISLTVRVVDWNTNEAIPNVEVYLEHQSSGKIQSLTTNEEGKARIITDDHSVWSVTGTLHGEAWDFIPIHTSHLLADQDNTIDIFLSQEDETVEVKDFVISPVALIVRVVDWDSNEPIPNVEVFLTHQQTSEKQSLVTNKEGKAKVITDNRSVWDVTGTLNNKPWEFLPIHTNQLLANENNTIDIFLSQEDETVEVRDFVISPISLTVRVVDWNTNEAIPNVEVYLEHQSSGKIQSLTTNEEGKARIITDDHSVWSVTGTLSGEPWDFIPIHTSHLLADQDNTIDIFLSQEDETVEVKDYVISPVALIVRVVDWDSNEPIPNVEVFLDNQRTSERRSMVTDYNGNVKIITDNRSVWNVTGTLNGEPWEFLPIHTDQLLVSEDNTVEIFLFQNTEAIQAMDVIVFDRHDNKGDILVSIDDEIYQFEQIDNQNYLVQGDKRISLFRSDASVGAEKGLEEKMDEIFFQEGVPVRSITVINTVYFDFNQASVRKNASAELRKLAAVLTKHTNLTIYLDAHTDSRGSNNYNMQLSKRRASRVQQYLAQQGVNTNQVMLQYYGEKKLRNKCSNNAPCDTQSHQLNRRVEFRVVDFSFHSTPMIAG